MVYGSMGSPALKGTVLASSASLKALLPSNRTASTTGRSTTRKVTITPRSVWVLTASTRSNFRVFSSRCSSSRTAWSV